MNDPRPLYLAFVAFLMIMAFGVVCVALAVRYRKREMQHRERLAALEKGVASFGEPDPQDAPWTPRMLLLRGLKWLFAGIGLTVFLLGLSLSSQFAEPAAKRVLEADDARARGATREEIQQILADRHHDGPPVGLALIGLIPIGVGLAYLITYRADRTAEVR